MVPRRRSFARSLGHAWAGLAYVWRTQGNMRIHLGAAVAVLALARWLEVEPDRLLVLWLTVGLVVAAEAINTAIESAVDLAADSPHPVARRAKDVAAAAVLWTALVAVGVGVAVFAPLWAGLPEALAARWRQAPLEVLGVAVLAVALCVSGLRG